MDVSKLKSGLGKRLARSNLNLKLKTHGGERQLLKHKSTTKRPCAFPFFTFVARECERKTSRSLIDIILGLIMLKVIKRRADRLDRKSLWKQAARQECKRKRNSTAEHFVSGLIVNDSPVPPAGDQSAKITLSASDTSLFGVTESDSATQPALSRPARERMEKRPRQFGESQVDHSTKSCVTMLVYCKVSDGHVPYLPYAVSPIEVRRLVSSALSASDHQISFSAPVCSPRKLFGSWRNTRSPRSRSDLNRSTCVATNTTASLVHPDVTINSSIDSSRTTSSGKADQQDLITFAPAVAATAVTNPCMPHATGPFDETTISPTLDWNICYV